MKKSQLARITLAVVVCLSAFSLIAADDGRSELLQVSTPTATPTCPPGQEWTPWGGCRAIPQPCSAGTIDINGNGNNDGGSDCQPLDSLTKPTYCAVWPAGPGLTAQGFVNCSLPLSMNGQPLRVTSGAGCVDVTRKPYPRAVVNTKTTFTVNGLFSNVQNIVRGQPGWYRLSPDNGPWATEGLYLHENYGNVTFDANGRPAFNTDALLAGDSYPYPSFNNLRAIVRLFIAGSDDTFRWTVTGLDGATASTVNSAPVERVFAFASYPLGRPYPISNIGPDRVGQNTLPAFHVALRATWEAWLMVEWDNYFVDGNNAYVRGAHEGYAIRLGDYYSYRAWDRQQPLAGVESIYCNASANSEYMPVPVLEAQSVLKQ